MNVEEYQPRSGAKSVNYEHCDAHDRDATNGCPKCEEEPEVEPQIQGVGPLAREVESIEFCLTTLAEQRDEANAQLRAAQLETSEFFEELQSQYTGVVVELRLARATRQGDLADGLRDTLAKRIAEAHDVDEYQRDAGLTATNIPNRQTEILVRCLKLASEAGELADIVGSAIEGSAKCDLTSMRARVEGELGDVLWYAARIATLFDLKLSDVTTKNLAKVRARVTGGYWQGTACESCGNLVTVLEPNECPFCGAK